MVRAAVVVASGPVSFGLAYLLALAGEPRCLWLVRDILGWM